MDEEKLELESTEQETPLVVDRPEENGDEFLADILKEFGGGADEGAVEETEEPAEETPEEASDAEDKSQEQPAVTSDTIRLDTLSLEQDGFRSTQVRGAQPIEDEEDEEEEEQGTPAEEKVAFEGDWEPEYEQPMGEYIPQPPIIMHPRSRLRELKRKLVEGPERIYYSLVEKGLGKLQAAIFFHFLVIVGSILLSLLLELNVIPDDRLRLVVFCQFLAMLISALLGSNRLIEGAGDLFKGRFSLNAMLVITFLLCCADGIFGLMERRIPCCAAFGLEMTMSLWNAYHRRNTQMGQMDTMRKAIRLDCIRACPDYLDGKKGFLRAEGQVEDFMDTYDQPAKPEKVLSLYTMIATVVSVLAGVAMGVWKGPAIGVQIAAVMLLAAVPATAFIAVSRPMAVLERRLHSLGAVLCGWQGVEGLNGKALFPVTNEDLFPAGTVRMNGVKFFSQRDPDQVVAYAGALITADGGSLAVLFENLVSSRNAAHYSAENFRYYDGGGIGGEVCGEPVLVGSLSFLRDMGVEVPADVRVESAVCVAVDGELCGLFALSYDKLKTVASGVVTLSGYRGLQPVLISNDFMLTERFLSGIFGIKPGRVLYPEHADRAGLQLRQPEGEEPALALSTTSTMTSFAFCVTGARALKTASKWGVLLHLLGGILGIGAVAVLALLGGIQYLTPVNMFLYQLVWIIPALLITEWTRSV